MKALLLRVGLAAFIVALLSALHSGAASADDTKYRFKWPYRPGVASPTTTLPGQGGHADAWDFDIGANDTGDEVVSSAEGTVLFSTSAFDANSCDPNTGDGFGNHVKVLVPIPDPQPDITITYAHLTSASVATSARILQGDQVGIEGKTGHTLGSEPPGYPVGSDNCGTHLHFQFNPARPSDIDGQDVSAPPPGGSSTNSIVGAFTVPGAAIRQKYFDLGAVYTSWAVVGWTADRSGTQAGCPSGSFCRLYVHYAVNPVTGHWGSRQDFRQHPDGDGYEYSSIMVGRWAVNDAYFVPKGIFATWWAGYGQGIGLPVREVMPANPFAYCVTSTSGCVRWQRFHMGYIWEHNTLGFQPPVFCPDVAPPYPNEDHYVSIFDVLAVASAYGAPPPENPDGHQPYEAWPNARYDVDGDGTINVVVDILVTSRHFGRSCYPG